VTEVLCRARGWRAAGRNPAAALLGLSAAILSVTGSSCGERPGPAPALSVAASPRYPCQGDPLTITFVSDRAEQVQVIDGRGQVAGEARGPAGTITLPRIDRAMLPLTVRARIDGATHDLRAPGSVPLGVIDASTPTEVFPLPDDARGPDARRQMGTQDCGCTLDDDGAPLECEKAAAIYEVRTRREGGTGKLDAALFSPKAHVVALVNRTPYDLTYFHGDNRIAVVPTGGTQEIDFASEIAPRGQWTGKIGVARQTERYAGTFIDGGPVCTGWVDRAPDPPPPTPPISLGFALRCSE
jgi:hypothetical protein